VLTHTEVVTLRSKTLTIVEK